MNHIKPTRSNEYIQLIQQLKDSFHAPIDIALKLFEQGKKDGLCNEVIREDIELALEGIIKERQLRNVLPLELKRKYTVDPNSAMIAELREKYVREKYEAINKATHGLWYAYTNGQRPHPPNNREDLEDFIRPTREFVKKVVHELQNRAPDMLLAMFNDLVCTEALIKDFIQTLQDAGKREVRRYDYY
jgi:hypothetical protein